MEQLGSALGRCGGQFATLKRNLGTNSKSTGAQYYRGVMKHRLVDGYHLLTHLSF